MQKLTFRSLAAAVALGVALAGAPAQAHDSSQGPNGGEMVEVKGHHVEFVAKGSDVTLYLSDEAHKAIASQGATGRLVILDGQKQSTVPLAPADPDKLTARLDAPLAAGARVVVSAKLSDGHDILARFVVK